MADMDVRIVRMHAFTGASFRAEGTSPEMDAIGRMLAWAGPRGLMDGPRGYHWFGANDPPPSRAGGRYGYFSMLTVPPDLDVGADVEVKRYDAMTWAVTRLKGLEHITRTWQALHDWVGRSARYRIAGHGLEEVLTPPGTPFEDMVFDLWLPVEE